MLPPSVFLVHLRRPYRSKDSLDPRTDPLYEFGSFGCTGCHGRNLLHPKNQAKVEDSRLAFAQGGDDGFRLVFLTSSVRVLKWGKVHEARWDSNKMPFKYDAAPLLVSNLLESDFPLLFRFVSDTQRSTVEGGFSSRFRSSVTCLTDAIAEELVENYERMRADCATSDIAKEYWQALPYTNGVQSLADRRTIYRGFTAGHSTSCLKKRTIRKRMKQERRRRC